MKHMSDQKLFRKIYPAIAFTGIASLIPFVYGLQVIDRYLHEVAFLVLGVFTGVVAGMVLTQIVYFFKPGFRYVISPTRVKLWFMIPLVTMALAMGLGSTSVPEKGGAGVQLF
jgi:hypothetical protein